MKLTNIFGVIIVLLLVLLKCNSNNYSDSLEGIRVASKKEKLRNDTLVKVNDSLYTKLVADTLKLKDIKRINDSLQLELNNPKTIIKTVFVPKSINTEEATVVVVKDSSVVVVDYYPSKAEMFIKYTAKINLLTNTSKGLFEFKPIDLNLGIGQQEDGTYYVNTSVPAYIDITTIDVQSLPIKETKHDNFGWLLGGGVGYGINSPGMYFRATGGLRVHKFYLNIGINSVGSGDVGVMVEF